MLQRPKEELIKDFRKLDSEMERSSWTARDCLIRTEGKRECCTVRELKLKLNESRLNSQVWCEMHDQKKESEKRSIIDSSFGVSRVEVLAVQDH